MAEGLFEFTDGSFDSDVIRSDLPVLVDFWAAWCGPCKAIAPVIQEIAIEYSGKVKVGKVDVDQNNQIAMQYGIRSIPTFLIIKDYIRMLYTMYILKHLSTYSRNTQWTKNGKIVQ